MSLHNMRSLASTSGINYRTLINYRKRYIESKPELKEKFGSYGRTTAHILTQEQVVLMIENIPHLKKMEV